MRRTCKLKIALADWLGRLGFLLAGGFAAWCLLGVWVNHSLVLLPVMAASAAVAAGMYLLADWADRERDREEERERIRASIRRMKQEEARQRSYR